MARTVKNLSHILITLTETVDAFTVGEVTYKIYSKIPASAVIALIENNSPIGGMRDYILECLVEDPQKAQFLTLIPKIDVDGLSALIEEIVAAVTPFDGTKPSD